MTTSQLITLFFGSLFLALLEGIAQFFWNRPYFTSGIPLARISNFEFENLKKRKKVNCREDNGVVLIRQKYYGIARYAYFHGFIRP